METCKTCKFWNNGICNFVDNKSDKDLQCFEIVVRVNDDHGLSASLKTGPNFGCVHHSLLNKPIANVSIAIGYNIGKRWVEESFKTDLTYEECKDETLLMASASKVFDFEFDVAFVHLTNYEQLVDTE